jgi:hypothetical protein
MHILPASLLGFVAWVVILIAAPSIYAVAAAPFIVSGVALLLVLIPGLDRREIHGATVTYTLAVSMLIVVGSLMLI